MFNNILRLITAVFLDICILASMSLYLIGQEGIILDEIISTILKILSIGFLYITRDKKKSADGSKFVKWMAIKIIPGIGSFFATNTGLVLSGA